MAVPSDASHMACSHDFIRFETNRLSTVLMNDSEDTSELRNPFPSPPSHYVLYTSHNLSLLSLLKERDPENTNNNQTEILNDQNEVPDWPLTQLEKPRVDWILEEPDAYYDVFGDRWFVR